MFLKSCIFILLSLFALPYSGQIFSETFNEANGSTTGTDANGISWSATCNTCQCATSDYVEVQNGVLEAQDTNGKGIWETDDFSISSCTDGLTISVDITEVGSMEDATSGGCNQGDGIKFEYSYDGGATWEAFADATSGTTDTSVFMSDCGTCGDPLCSSGTYPVPWCGDEFSGPLIGTGEFGSTTFSGCASTGTTLRLRATFVCWAGSEVLQIDNVTVSCSNCALPITLVSFNASYNPSANHSELNWQTAAEINNDYFTLEKSKNGKVFSPFKTIEGAGNSNEIRDYISLDKNPYQGVTYYRLKQTDYDGEYAYSDIIAIETTDNENLTLNEIRQNPGSIEIFYSSEGKSISTRLVDLRGRVVAEKETPNEGMLNVEKSTLDKGVYILHISDGYDKKVEKVFVK